MTTPTPHVALKDQCSIIHNNTLYVYSPDAFQTLSLQEGGQWKQETNGVSVQGAQCVYGGIDGQNDQSALYVVGGIATESNSNYTGLQRYSISDKSWTTITPVVQVTQNRQFHGAAYINSSSGLIIYGGSQQGSTGDLSSETFFIEMYPPYRVQAYASSKVPPAKSPLMMPWSEERALMVGGSGSNVDVFTFGAADGWENLGVTLPSALPNSSVAQAALLSLDDGSKILQVFDFGQEPVSVSSNVLLNAGGGTATSGEVAGVSSTSSSSSATAAPTSGTTKRQSSSLTLSTFPIYNSTNAPNTTRTDWSLAQSEGGLLAFVGGDANSTVSFFNQTRDGWVLAEQILGSQTTSSTSSQSTSSTTATATQSSSSNSGGSGRSHRSAILGGVLGGVLGLLAIILLVLLGAWCARKKKRRRRSGGSGGQQRQSGMSFTSGKSKHDAETEEGLQSLSANSQPMGLSPVQSAILTEARTSALFVQNPAALVRPQSNSSSTRGLSKPTPTAHRLFHRERSGLAISKPMNPDLGDYALRQSPSIDLGRATPATPLNSTALFSAVAASNIPTRNKSHRRTDEAWAKYFSNDALARAAETSATSAAAGTLTTEGAAATAAATRAAPPLRDSNGRPLEINSVTTNSPVLENRWSDARTRTLTGQISSAESIVSSEYEDDEVIDEGLSSGVPSFAPQQRWTPLADSLRRHSSHGARPAEAATRAAALTATAAVTRTETSSSDKTSGSKESQLSGIPNFPMPGSRVSSQVGQPRSGQSQNISQVRPVRKVMQGRPPPDDLSWLRL